MYLQVLAVSGDGEAFEEGEIRMYTVKVDGKPRKDVPGNHLAGLHKCVCQTKVQVESS